MHPRRVTGGAVAALALAGSFAAPAHAADVRSETTTKAAVAWLADQQQPDGRIGTGGATETADAVLALAEAAQPTLAYDPSAARAAVASVASGDATPLTYLDDVADGDIKAGIAARLVLVAAATGLDPLAFDPEGDGAKNLAAEIDADESGGSYGFFYDTLLVAVAHPALGRAVPDDTITLIRDAQRADGGFNYTGDHDTGEFSGSDTDVTGTAVQALVAAGEPAGSDVFRRALAFLAAQQNGDGGFHSSFSADSDPVSTRSAVLGIAAAGYDPVSACWRDAVDADVEDYVDPDTYLRGAQDASGRIGPASDFQPTQNTSTAVQSLLRTFQPIAAAVPQPCDTTGYRLVALDGGVFTHGAATFAGSTGDVALNEPIVTAAATPDGRGYWLFARDGGVFTFGGAPFLGSTGALRLNAPIVAGASTPTGGGYWLFAADGGVFTFGDAAFLGSTADTRLNAPIVAAAATPSGAGYWLFGADGGVFTFGDAPFAGSTGAMRLAAPVVGAAGSRGGEGYLLFAADGGVFAFGDASFSGSMGGKPLNAPVVGGARSRGDGYYLVAGDGGVFAFDAPFLGSEGGRRLNSPVITLAVS